MKKLLETKKITLASVKAFINRNKGNIYAKSLSHFDGMVDCVVDVESNFVKIIPDNIIIDAYINRKWKGTEETYREFNHSLGIPQLYLVGDSADYFYIYEKNEYFGIEIYNCCGSSIIAIKK
jgi:hypothetical protein